MVAMLPAPRSVSTTDWAAANPWVRRRVMVSASSASLSCTGACSYAKVACWRGLSAVRSLRAARLSAIAANDCG